MSARDSVNGEQLAMFMRPTEILQRYAPNDGDRLRSLDDSSQVIPGEQRDGKVWRRKQIESTVGRAENAMHQGVSDKFPSLQDSVAREGVQHPIGLGTVPSRFSGKPMLTAGHHRLAAAAEARPNDYVPVLHHTNVNEHQATLKSEVPRSHRDAAGEIVRPWGRYL